VLANAAVLGIEADSGLALVGVGEQLLRWPIIAAYLTEMCVRLYADWRGLVTSFLGFVDLLIVALASLCVIALGGEPVWLWRITLIRTVRFLRVRHFALNWWPIKDLWLVLESCASAGRALAAFALVLTVILVAAAGSFIGLVEPGSGDFEGECDKDYGAHLFCIDAQEFFGSVPKALLTLLQMVTLDGWASKVVRPLSKSRPWAAAVMAAFSIIVAYGILSILTGMLVRTTMDLAQSHESHASNLRMTEDLAVIKSLRDYYEASLVLDERTTIDLRTLSESMCVPAVKKAYDQLDLPLRTPEDLMDHLDRARSGTLTVEDFGHGVAAMKKPSTNYDVACLTATIGGSVTYCTRIERRSQKLVDQLDELRYVLGSSFVELGKIAQPGGASSETEQVPEVHLRLAGRIFNPVPPEPPRYTR